MYILCVSATPDEIIDTILYFMDFQFLILFLSNTATLITAYPQNANFKPLIP